MKTLAVIPARSGSKRLPQKNILPLGGKPLIAWTIEALRNTPGDLDVIVSTDCPKIADVSRQWGADVPFLRPAEFCTDQATSRDLLLHALDTLDPTGQNYEAISLFQPTSPFRTARHIEEAMAMFVTRQAQSVLSVVECEHPPHIALQRDPHSRMIRPLYDGPYNSQLLDEIPVRPNGAIYLFRIDFFRDNACYYGDNSYGYAMSAETSVDIDTPLDYEFAAFLMDRNRRCTETPHRELPHSK